MGNVYAVLISCICEVALMCIKLAALGPFVLVCLIVHRVLPVKVSVVFLSRFPYMAMHASCCVGTWWADLGSF